jgi:dihydrofolate reductase
MKIVLVAAVADNDVIGANGGMPWRLKSDLAHFRALTINKPVVMGRKTFESIGKPLKDRTNIVVTRDASRSAAGVVFVPSFAEAMAAARADAERRGTDEIMIIGGVDIFNASMPLADRLEVTHVHARPEGDVKFPPIDPAVWRQISAREHPAGPNDSASFTVAAYVRR